jgi:type IV secretory pathway component VirB8
MSELKSISKKEKNKDDSFVLSTILIGLFVVTFFHAGYSVLSNYFSDSILIGICPRSDSNGSPVIISTISKTTVKQKDTYIRDFTHRFLRYAFPRSQKDTEEFFTNAYNMSVGSLHYKYESYMDAHEEIGEKIASGFFWRFYAKNSLNIVIAKDDVDNEWEVEIDAYLIKNDGYSKEVRYNPTIRLTIETGDATRRNPTGLYVSEMNIDQITNYVSGNKIPVQF